MCGGVGRGTRRRRQEEVTHNKHVGPAERGSEPEKEHTARRGLSEGLELLKKDPPLGLGRQRPGSQPGAGRTRWPGGRAQPWQQRGQEGAEGPCFYIYIYIYFFLLCNLLIFIFNKIINVHS